MRKKSEKGVDKEREKMYYKQALARHGKHRAERREAVLENDTGSKRERDSQFAESIARLRNQS